MKKIASMVGVGAMVITFGIGSLCAQQQPTGTVPAVVEKDKVPVAKPKEEAKTDKATAVTNSPAKPPEMKPAEPVKPSNEKSGNAVKVDKKAAPETKHSAVKSGNEVKADKSAATTKPSDEKPSEKAGEAKPAKQ